MSYCPIMSYQRENTPNKACMEEYCAFADEAGECLIRQALQCYVAKERTRVAEEESARTYWAIKKDGTRTPIQFSHTPEDYPYPHGGTYEDLTGLREKYDIGPIPDVKNPIRQVKTSDAETGVGY